MMNFNLRRGPFNPAVEPRTQEPSLHNPIYSALPLSQLQHYRNVARYEDIGGNEHPTRTHHLSLLKTDAGAPALGQAWVQTRPATAFTGTK